MAAPSRSYEEATKNLVIVKPGRQLEKITTMAYADPTSFWADQARKLTWFKEWEQVLDWKPPFARWFRGGLLNASVNCLDVHVNSEIKNKAAILWEGEGGETRTLTYFQLFRAVNKLANALKSLGVGKGDRVTIYLPMVPELPISMLACARIGAVHSVVFSGFSSQALADRIIDAGSKIVITSDIGTRKGKVIQLKSIVDDAIKSIQSVNHVIVLKRSQEEPTLGPKDLYWHELMQGSKSHCTPEMVESSEPLFILYTSGTTGKPKGVIHGTGGYLTHIYSTAHWIFDFRKEDIFFCTADIGWVTGHSYMVYAPLMHGVTELMYEGAPDFPQPDRYWSLIEKYGATILYTTPTALRMYMKYGDSIPKSFDLSSLRLLGTVGEPINPEVWSWYFKNIGNENCPVVDTWWQTETGGAMLSMCTAIETIPMKPGSATTAIPGIDIAVVNEHGDPALTGTKGYLVIRKPWPGMLLGLWNDDEKYRKTYWEKFGQKGMPYYYPGDYALLDSDGYFWLLGRADDVLKIAGHRLGTMELESAFVSHKAIAESAVVGKPDNTKGEAIIAFVVPKEGFVASDHLREELILHIRNVVGPIATPSEIYFVSKLPKTRSGKIMRRLLKSIACEQKIGDVSTLEDGAAVDEIRQAYQDLKESIR